MTIKKHLFLQYTLYFVHKLFQFFFIMTIYMSYLYERNDSRYYKQKHYERKVTQLGLQAIKWLQAQLIHKEF